MALLFVLGLFILALLSLFLAETARYLQDRNLLEFAADSAAITVARSRVLADPAAARDLAEALLALNASVGLEGASITDFSVDAEIVTLRAECAYRPFGVFSGGDILLSTIGEARVPGP